MGLTKSTPSGTVCLGGGPILRPCGPSPTGVVWAGPRECKEYDRNVRNVIGM